MPAWPSNEHCQINEGATRDLRDRSSLLGCIFSSRFDRHPQLGVSSIEPNKRPSLLALSLCGYPILSYNSCLQNLSQLCGPSQIMGSCLRSNWCLPPLSSLIIPRFVPPPRNNEKKGCFDDFQGYFEVDGVFVLLFPLEKEVPRSPNID